MVMTINLNRILLCIVLNNETDRVPITPEEVTPQSHHKRKTTASFGPITQAVSIWVTLVRGRFSISAKGKKQPGVGMWISSSIRKGWEHCKHYSVLPTVSFICAICLASLVGEAYEHLCVIGQLVPGRFNTQLTSNNQRNMSAQQRHCSLPQNIFYAASKYLENH